MPAFLRFMVAPALLALLLVAPRRHGRRPGRIPRIDAVLVLAFAAAGYGIALLWPYLLASIVLRHIGQP